MLGYIKKDLLVIVNNFKSLGLFFLVYIVFAFVEKMDISFLPPFITFMLVITSFNYDNYNNYDAYGVTLPSGRRNIVLSKYLVSIGLVVLASVIALGISFLTSYSNPEFNMEITLLTSLATILTLIFIISILFPFVFKFGIEKARIGILILVFGIAIFGSLIIKFINLKNMNLNFLNNSLTPYIIVLIIITLAILSYLISKRIYKTKEF